jgi:type IX secretion system PorP/SprF family membrane protein
MAKRLILFLVVTSISCSFAFCQQTFQFSQYMFNGLVINPAYAGADEAPSLTFYNRSQWGGVDGAPKTQTLSAHTLFARQRVGTGLTLINDRIGVHQTLIISGAASYHLRLSSSSVLSFGLQAGFSHRESDYKSLGANISNDPKVAGTAIAQNMLDIGAGIYFRSAKIDIGVSAPQLLPGKMPINDTVSIKFNKTNVLIFSRLKLDVSNALRIEPGFLLKYYPGTPFSYDLNANLIFHKVIIAGVSYRKEESVDFLLRVQATPQLQFGYGYDHVIGEVSAISQASHELMINFVFRSTRNNLSTPR